ncbi:MAG TPA: hypothetical protein DDZ53_10790 [Firmicutes bacterium]|nr:hypothetical protein [Bacillota bacterium]
MGRRCALFVIMIVFFHLLCSVMNIAFAEDESSELPKLIRLHVLANGESLEDQRVKLVVRDELLAVLNPLLATAASMEEAEEIIKANLVLLSQTAEQALVQAKVDYQARLQLGLFNFPDKYYGTYSLPAGRYMALNVTLGTGAGRNWWCVIFPAMCYTAEVCQQTEADEPQVYHLRSKVVEMISKVVAWCIRLKS